MALKFEPQRNKKMDWNSIKIDFHYALNPQIRLGIDFLNKKAVDSNFGGLFPHQNLNLS